MTHVLPDGTGIRTRPIPTGDHVVKRTKIDGSGEFSPALLKPSGRKVLNGTPPNIVQKLKAQEIKAGNELRLHCVVQGYPLPEVTWTRNNIPIQNSDRATLYQDDQGNIELIINNARIEDSGVYMATIKNSFGIAKVSCQILVTAVSPIGTDVGQHALLANKAPMIIRYPDSRAVQINETVVAEAEMRIFIDTRIIWLFEEHPLVATTRISTSFENSIARLTIKNFQEEDYGVYCIKAINSDGQSMYKFALQKSSDITNLMKEPLTEVHNRRIALQPAVYLQRSLKPVISKLSRVDLFAPIMLKPIRNAFIRSGLNVVFDAVIKASPNPEIIWLFNGQPIKFNENIYGVYSEVTHEATLTILNISAEQYGSYTLIARNSEGEIKCSAKLTEEQICEDEIQPFHGISEGVSLSSANVPSEPNFLLKSGIDSLGFVNMDSINELERKRRHEASIDPEIVEKEKPMFLQPLKAEFVISEGENLLLRALIKTPSMPEFIWLKDDGTQASSNRVTSHFDPTTGWVTLQIQNVIMPDSGLYALIVKTFSGSCTSNSSVRVIPSPSIESRTYVSTTNFAKLDQKCKEDSAEVVPGVETRSLVSNFSAFEKLEAPKRLKETPVAQKEYVLRVEEQLMDVEANENEEIHLKLKVRGDPLPLIQWYKDEVSIQTGSRIMPGYDPYSHEVMLLISHCSISDSGQYKIKATNPVGTVESLCLVKIKSVPAISQTPFKPLQLFKDLDTSKIETREYTSGIDQTSYAMGIDKIVSLEAKPLGSVQEEGHILTPPQFLTEFQDSEWEEGTNLLISLILHGQPQPKIEWYKDGHLLSASNRIVTNYNILSRMVTLQLNFVVPLDAGRYIIRATNAAGSAEKSAFISVNATDAIQSKSVFDPAKFVTLDQKEKVVPIVQPGVDTTAFVSFEKFKELERWEPRMIEYIEDTSQYRAPQFMSAFAPEYKCEEGNILQLVCIVTGFPLPQFAITKDGRQLQSSNRCKFDYNMASKLFCLSVGSARDSDTGTYNIIASNKLGKVECATNVMIHKSKTIDTDSMISLEAVRHLEEKLVEKKDVVAGVDTSAFVDNTALRKLEVKVPRPIAEPDAIAEVAPTLYKGLSDSGIDVNGDLCLFSQLFGLPIPEIEWTLEGCPLRASSRLIIHYDILTKTAYLWIKKASVSDSGRYKLCARNRAGEVETSCLVRVYDQPNIDKTAFVNEARIAEIDSKPEVDKFASLVPGVDQTAFMDHTKLQDLEIKPIRQTDIVEPADREPHILKPLLDYQIKEGQYTVLEALVDTLPVRNLHWYYNGVLIPYSSDLRPEEDLHAKSVRLIIKSAKKDQHEGEYKVVLANRAGQCSSACRILIDRTPGIDSKAYRPTEKYEALDRPIKKELSIEPGVDTAPQTTCPGKFTLLEVATIGRLEFQEDPSKHYAPVFERPLQPIEGKELSAIVLSAVCRAQPLPSFMWFQNDEILMESNRFSSHYDILTNTISLSIVGLKLFDTGTYTIVAVNPLGTEKSVSTLIVRPDDFSSISRDMDKYTNLEKKIAPPEYTSGVYSETIAGDLQRLGKLEKEKAVKDIVPGVDSQGFVDIHKFTPFETKHLAVEHTHDDSVNYKSPRILSPFVKQISVDELENVTLHATLEANPLPDLEWTLNNRPVTSSNRYILSYDMGTHLVFLQIRSARPFDAGRHIVRVKNPLGQCEFVTDLSVNKIASIDHKSFIGMSAFDGLEAPRSIPISIMPGIDSTSYITSEHYRTLDVKPPRVLDIVPGVDQTSFIDVGVIRDLEKPVPCAVPEVVPLPPIAPIIITHIKDAQINEHDDVSISAGVSGRPVPQLIWKKDGRVLDASSKFVPHYNLLTKTAYLLIRHALDVDAGKYSLEAINTAGKVSTEGTVTVKKSKAVDYAPFVPAESFSNLIPATTEKYADLVPGVDSSGTIPKEKYENLELKPVKRIVVPEEIVSPVVIKKDLKDLTINENEGFCLEAQVEGKPPPMFVWYLNNQPVMASDNCQVSYNLFTKMARLLVKSANAEIHSGQYELIATGQSGDRVTSKANVVVKRQSLIDMKTSRDMAKFKALDVKLMQADATVAGVDFTSFSQNLQRLSALERKPVSEIIERDEANEIPKFVGPLTITKDHANEFDLTAMSVTVTGRPSPEFYLMKDGKLVISSNRIAVHYESKSCVLTVFIRDLLKEDTGSYYIVAYNSMGSTLSSRVQLNVAESLGIDETTNREIARFKGLEREVFKPLDIVPGVDSSGTADLRKLELLEVKPSREYDFIPGVDRSEFVPSTRFHHLEVVRPKEVDKEDVSRHRPPVVISPLTEITANETQNVLLTAMIDGYPMPEFVWKRNNQRVPFSNRYSAAYDPNSKLLSLVIRHALKKDEGVYSVEGMNAAGCVSSSAKLHVTKVQSIDRTAYVQSGDRLAKFEQEPPGKIFEAGIETGSMVDFGRFSKFEAEKPSRQYEAGIDQTAMIPDARFIGLEKPIQIKDYEDDFSMYRMPLVHKPLENVDITEGDAIVLSCVVDGVPIPRFEWFKNDRPIAESNRFKSDYEINSKVCRLYINGSVQGDCGVYTLLVSNSNGKVQTSCNVNVKSTASIESGSFSKSIDKLIKLDEPSKRIKAPEPAITLIAPSFTKKHQSEIALTEGSDLNLAFEVTGYPLPTFIFFKNGVQLSSANRNFYHYDVYGKKLYLKVSSLNLSDAGMYTCRARNQAGEDIADFSLIVHPISSIDQSSRLKDPEGILTRLDNMGVQTTVVIEPGVDQRSYAKNMDVIKKLDADKDRPLVEVISKRDRLAPVFIEQLKQVSVVELQPIFLSAKLNKPNPICNISWHKDDREIQSSNQCSINYNLQTQEVFLYIPMCTRDHAGLYRLRATNGVGDVQTEASVSVQPIQSIDVSTSRDLTRYAGLEEKRIPLKDITAGVESEPSEKFNSIRKLELQLAAGKPVTEKETPAMAVAIIDPLKDIGCTEGDSIILSTIVRGSPLPKFEWLRDGKLIPNANRFTSHYDLLSNTLFLRIKGVSIGDAGSYTLTATNPVNQVQTAAKVQVSKTKSIVDTAITSDFSKYAALDLKEKPLLTDLRPEIDTSAKVPMERFEKFERATREWMPIDWVPIDCTSYIPQNRLDEVEALNRRILKQYTGGVDKGPIVGEDTLGRLKQMDEFKVSEVFEPLEREYRLVLVKPMEEQISIEGTPVSLYCTVDAYPLPQFDWYHNGKPIEDSQRLIPHYDPYTGLVALHFMMTNKRDIGHYIVKIRNSGGEVISECDLKLNLVPDIDETPYIAKSSYTALESLHQRKQLLSIEADEGFNMFPSIIHVNSQIKLVEFVFKPTHLTECKIKWMLSGVDVSDKIKVIKDEQKGVVLVSFILDAIQSQQDKENKAKLICVIENSKGVFQRLVNISMVYDNEDAIAPQFEHELESRIVDEGSPLNIEALVSGSPSPSIEWTKDDIPVGNVYKTTFSHNLCSLSLAKANRSDSGWFKCILSNSAGTATSACKIIVINPQVSSGVGRTGETTSFSPTNLKSVEFQHRKSEQQPNVGKMFLAQLKRSRPVIGTSNEQSMEIISSGDVYKEADRRAPSFKIHLPPVIDCIESHGCKLQVTVVPINDPGMIVQWYKNDAKLEAGDRISVMFDMGYVVLEIRQLLPEDSGIYECVAKNKYGEDKTRTQLMCQATKQIFYQSSLSPSGVQMIEKLEDHIRFGGIKASLVDAPKSTSAPLFSSTLQDISLNEGDATKFIVNLNADPRARVQWFMNGKSVVSSGRIKTDFDGMICSLTIVDSRMTDDGIVKCVARNRLGQADVSCRLNIKPAKLPAYWDLVIKAALELDLTPDEVNKIHREVEDKITEHRKRGLAQDQAEAAVKKFIEDVRSKHAEIKKMRSSKKLEDDGPKAPRFLSQLPASSEIPIGDLACLKVKFDPPTSSLAWYRKNVAIENSRDSLISTSSSGISTLTIRRFSKEDCGLYTAKLYNAIGSSQCSCEVKAIEVFSRTTKDGAIKFLPSEVRAILGADVCVQCVCQERVIWSRQEGKMPPPSRVRRSDDTQTNLRSLRILKLSKEDAGEYSCSVKSEERKFKLNLVESLETSVKVLQHFPPTISVGEGDWAELACSIWTIDGGKSQWTRNDILLTDNRTSIEIIDCNELRILRIFGIQKSDSGTYQCKVTTSSGDEKCSTTKVTVTEAINKEAGSLFIDTIKSCAVIGNESLTLKFEAENGCKINWLKDNKPLISSKNLELVFDHGKGMLFIPNVLHEDGGVYTCKATLQNRQSQCGAQITVRKA